MVLYILIFTFLIVWVYKVEIWDDLK
jgi:hypothetical protein